MKIIYYNQYAAATVFQTLWW